MNDNATLVNTRGSCSLLRRAHAVPTGWALQAGPSQSSRTAKDMWYPGLHQRPQTLSPQTLSFHLRNFPIGTWKKTRFGTSPPSHPHPGCHQTLNRICMSCEGPDQISVWGRQLWEVTGTSSRIEKVHRLEDSQSLGHRGSKGKSRKCQRAETRHKWQCLDAETPGRHG